MYVESSCHGYSGDASLGIESHLGSCITVEYFSRNISGFILDNAADNCSSLGHTSSSITGLPSVEIPKGSVTKSTFKLPAIAYATTNGGLDRYEALTF